MSELKSATKQRVVVVGDGMVSHRFVEELAQLDGAFDRFEITVIGEERHAAYDRVGLSKLFEGIEPEKLALPLAPACQSSVAYRRGVLATAIDRANRSVELDDGTAVAYDHLVLATGSRPFVPPVPGADATGCFVYRTLDDCDAITRAASTARSAVVIGGGLLGLEAANALRLLRVQTTVIEFAPTLMAVQVDEFGGAALQARVVEAGLRVLTRTSVKHVMLDEGGRVIGVDLGDGQTIDADMVVFATGVRPRDDLARAAGLEMGERGGVVIDEQCVTSDPAIAAIGEVACRLGKVYGLVAPGYEMAHVLASCLEGSNPARFDSADMSTKLKLVGIDVASIGNIHQIPSDAQSTVISDSRMHTYQRVATSADGTQVLAAVLVGDARPFASLLAVHKGIDEMPEDVRTLLLPESDTAAATAGRDEIVCSCNSVRRTSIVAAVAEGFTSVADIKACTRAGSTCGSCVSLIESISATEQEKAGVAVRRSLCEHFDQTRSELYDIIAVRNIVSFAELVSTVGRGLGCEICKPVVASILASRASGYILDGEQASLQDSNDHFLANLQRDGSYSVVPRVPGGEITPAQLIAIGQVAAEFNLYTKITGGQRIDLFGAQVDDLPRIWSKLIDVGLESGHAYGKALRTVKSCVGTMWCRYGVQDSVGFAVRVELRYRGLRAPHKIKMAVSGCARECAEAQSKDIGFIATERGYNLYVCGNGGMTPQHALLLASDLSEDEAVTLTDRILMYYVRTAERLERTAPWFTRRFAHGDRGQFADTGLEELRRVVVDDSLGICTDLEADMQRHVDSYACEWTETLSDPSRLERFVSFVNNDPASLIRPPSLSGVS